MRKLFTTALAALALTTGAAFALDPIETALGKSGMPSAAAKPEVVGYWIAHNRHCDFSRAVMEATAKFITESPTEKVEAATTIADALPPEAFTDRECRDPHPSRKFRMKKPARVVPKGRSSETPSVDPEIAVEERKARRVIEREYREAGHNSGSFKDFVAVIISAYAIDANCSRFYKIKPRIAARFDPIEQAIRDAGDPVLKSAVVDITSSVSGLFRPGASPSERRLACEVLIIQTRTRNWFDETGSD